MRRIFVFAPIIAAALALLANHVPAEAGRPCCGPIWTATADALFLHRSTPDSNVLAFNTSDPAENLNSDDFDFGTQAGFDLTLTKQLGSCNAIELRYFGVDHWDASVAAATTRDDLLRFNAAVPIFAVSGDAITAEYASQLHNSEVNLTHRLQRCFDVLVGFRYLELDESGGASLVNAATPFDYQVVTLNRLYGAQLGLHAWLWNSDFVSIDATGKAGVYGNHAAHDSTIRSGGATLEAGGHDDRAAFVGEIGVSGVALLTKHLSLRSGYRLLWLDGVAVASDQLGSSDYFSETGFNGAGEVFYHGAYVGLELAL